MEGANEYTLKGKGLSIRYSGTSLTGKPVLSVEWKRKKENFQMDRIRTVTSDLGTLVSVDLEATPDRDVIKPVRHRWRLAWAPAPCPRATSAAEVHG